MIMMRAEARAPVNSASAGPARASSRPASRRPGRSPHACRRRDCRPRPDATPCDLPDRLKFSTPATFAGHALLDLGDAEGDLAPDLHQAGRDLLDHAVDRRPVAFAARRHAVDAALHDPDTALLGDADVTRLGALHLGIAAPPRSWAHRRRAAPRRSRRSRCGRSWECWPARGALSRRSALSCCTVGAWASGGAG